MGKKTPRNLKISDVLISKKYGEVYARHPIEKITKKFAHIKGHKFKLDISMGVIEVPSVPYPSYTFFLSTDELEKELERKIKSN